MKNETPDKVNPDEVSADIAFVFGTRPEIIKIAQIVHLLGKRCFLIDTGQHYSSEMSRSVRDGFGLPEPDVELGIGGMARGVQLGRMTAALDELFRKIRPSAVVVQGDTTSALAGALAANVTDVPLLHVEAGLRSSDRAMPEEHSRVVI